MSRSSWIWIASFASLAIAAAACSGGSGSSDGTPTPTAPPATPTFANDIVPLMQTSCGMTDSNCHARNAYAADASNGCRGWLSLENTALGAVIYAGPSAGNPTGCPDTPLYERLTTIGSWECGAPASSGSQMAYVVPGDPASSYLYVKINGGPYCGSPPSAPMPLSNTLTATQIDMVRRWIAAGAPR